MTPTRMSRRLNLLFLSTGSACRALMAEAWTRALAGDALHCESSALEEGAQTHLVEQILGEAGLATTHLAYRRLDEAMTSQADLVILLGEWGDSRSVALPNGAGRIDWFLPRLHDVNGLGGDMLAGLRLTREMLRLKVAGLLKELGVRESGFSGQPGTAGGVMTRLGLIAGDAQPPAAALTAAAI